MIIAKYKTLAIRVDALQLRERLMLLIGIILLLFFMVDIMGFQPIYKQQKLLLQDIQGQETRLEVLRARSTLLYDDNSSEQPKPLEILQRELNSFSDELQLRLDSMLPPAAASNVLDQVMANEEGLTLNAVNTRQTPLTSIDSDTGRTVVVDDISRYELELKLEGGYLETLQYLRALEALPWKFIWTGISFTTTEYPNANVELEIYTLGQLGN